VWPRSGDFEFGAPVSLGPANAVKIADLDGDAIPDLAVSTSSPDDALRVLLGNGDGTFQLPLVTPLGPDPLLLVAEDFDGDGVPDLAVSTRATSSEPFALQVFLGHGDGGFEAAADPIPMPGGAAAAATDVDGDGVMDLVVPRFDGIGILPGNGDGSFGAPIPVPFGLDPRELVIADMNDDDCPDVVAMLSADVDAGGVGVLLNRCTQVLTAAIDIDPDDAANRLHPVGLGFTRVALIGAEGFDVTKIVQETLRFGPDGAAPARGNDVRPHDLDGDGFVDLVVRFPTRDAGIAFGDTEACVSGELADGTAFEGCDAIQTTGACGGGYALSLWIVPLIWLRGRRRSS
jgi:hypothetical protein